MWTRLAVVASRSQTGRKVIAVLLAAVALLLAYLLWLLVFLPLQMIGSRAPSSDDDCPPAGAAGSRRAVPAGTHRFDLGDSQDSAKALANLVGDQWDISEIGGWRPNDGYGEHVTGRALDVMVKDQRGDEIADYLVANAAAVGVDNVIWQQRIWSAARAGEGWRPMEDRGSDTQNHRDHVHTLLAPGAPVLQELPGMSPPAADSQAMVGPAPAPADPAAVPPFTVAPSEPYREGQSSTAGQEIQVDAAALRNVAVVAQVAAELWPDDTARRDRATLIATITMMVETGMQNYASSAVPETLQFPHDRVGSDHDSAGLFQQRVNQGAYGSAAQIMDPSYSTRMFFGAPPQGAPANRAWGLLDYERIKGKDWLSVDPGSVVADIQRPAESYRYRYGLWVEAAQKVIGAAAGINVAVDQLSPAGQKKNCSTGAAPQAPVGEANGANDYEPTRQGREGVDPWNFYWGECVSFTAWKVRTTTRHQTFTNNWTGPNGATAHFGNAKEWEAAGRAVGIPVDTTPAAGSIAVRRSGTAGHVAYVTKVHPDGKIDVAEYNFSARHAYGTRANLDWKNSGEFDVFIHFEQ